MPANPLLLVHCDLPVRLDEAGLPRCQKCKKAPRIAGNIKNTTDKPISEWGMKIGEDGAVSFGEGLELEDGEVIGWIDVPEGMGPTVSSMGTNPPEATR